MVAPDTFWRSIFFRLFFKVKSRLLLHCFFVFSVFALSRFWPTLVAEPWCFWEVLEARKLNFYGWHERRGALLDVHFLTGVVPQPELYNYPNHPAPIHWVNMFVQRGFGDWGIVALSLLLGFAACVAALCFLRAFYGPSIGLIGAVLFTIAPSSIIYDVDPNQGALGAALWPFAALCFSPGLSTLSRSWLLGFVCFLFGQASWMVWVVFGALLVGTAGISLKGGLSIAPVRTLLLALLIGGGLTVLGFLAQVLLYTSDWQNLFRYLQKQSAESVSFMAWLVRTTTRSAMSLGPGLALGALAGALVLMWSRTARPFELMTLAFLPLFGAASFALRGFFKTENWPFEYLVFPSSVLCCAFLSTVRAGQLRQLAAGALMALALPGLPYVFLRVSNPSLSAESLFIADLIAAEAKPQDIIATNLVDQEPPLPKWNVSGLYVARQKADRLLRSGIQTKKRLDDLLLEFHAKELNILYLYTPHQPIDAELKAFLAHQNKKVFLLPQANESLPFSLRLRDWYWRSTDRHQPSSLSASSRPTEALALETFYFTLLPRSLSSNEAGQSDIPLDYKSSHP